MQRRRASGAGYEGDPYCRGIIIRPAAVGGAFFMTAVRKKNLYQARSQEPFKLSRTKLELFLECPRCFYLDRRLGIGRPPGFPFTLNNAVDTLLKKEFDIHRAKQSVHPLMKAYGIDAVPLRHDKLNEWRHNFTGIQYLHRPTNLLIYGAVDDIWINPQGEYIVVDYKATSSDNEVSLDSEYRQAYKRQMEIYQWLLQQNGYQVAATGFFVYANGRKDRRAFDGKLEFSVTLLPYTGSTAWVDGAIVNAHQCLQSVTVPPAAGSCVYCQYRQHAAQAEKNKR